ncbi:WD40-repeat-containing domain protein [Blastocladiella britannica]|nr:WD40-repeat-containing domain protein [Blastocladiella britannica]
MASRQSTGADAEGNLHPKQEMVDLDDLMEVDDDNDDDDLMDIDNEHASESMRRAKAEHAAILDSIESGRRLRSIAVPTDDRLVRLKLREFGHPITLFGEGPAERRDRLRKILSTMDGVQVTFDDPDASDASDDGEEYFTPGTAELLFARRWIANHSLRRAQARLARQRQEFDTPTSVFKSLRRDLYADVKSWTPIASEIVDSRPVSFVAFAPNSKTLATGSFSGAVQLWSVPHCKRLGDVRRAHVDRVGGLAWHPNATVGLDASSANLVSGGAEGNVCLWSLDSESPITTLKGHTSRVSRVAYHPSGRYVGSSSFDKTWRLWDVESGTELLTQDGHAREVYAIAFHPDGSLAATGGLDGIGKVWDLRTGRCVLNLQGHLKQVLSVDFHPASGYQLATGSEDHSIKVWDLRRVACAATIPAHRSLVSQVKYFRADRAPVAADFAGANAGKYVRGHPATAGMFMIAGGYDGVVSVWADGDYGALKAMQGHEGKVMSVDVALNARFVASAGYDRTFKLWGPSGLRLEDEDES